MSLEALRAFMETGSIKEASMRLGRTQPQVSRLLAALEREIGFSLFVRRNRRLLPTEEARQFYLHVDHALRAFDHLRTMAGHARDQRSEHVRILTAPQVTDALVADAVRDLAARSPTFSATIDSRPRGGIELWIEREQFDLGVTVLPFEHPMFDAEEFVEVRAVALMAADHRLAERRLVTADDLAGEPLIATSSPSVLRQRLDRIMRGRGKRPDIRFETPSGTIACELAARGIGVALADPFVAYSQMTDAVAVRPFEPAIVLTYAFLYPVGQARSPTVTALCTAISETARKRSSWIIHAQSISSSAP